MNWLTSVDANFWDSMPCRYLGIRRLITRARRSTDAALDPGAFARSHYRHRHRQRWRSARRRWTLSPSPPQLIGLPVGQISKFLSSPRSKNISLCLSGKSSLRACAIPSRKRGVGHRHERWDGMRWTRQCARRACQCVRRSRVVLTPRRWRQVLEGLTLLGSDGDKTNSSPGSTEETVKTIACGNAGCFRRARGDYPVLTTLHRGCGCAGTRHSPRPLWGESSCTTRARCVARSSTHILRHPLHGWCPGPR